MSLNQLRYPPQFNTVPFGCYSNRGFHPSCVPNRVNAISEKVRADLMRSMFDFRQLIQSVLGPVYSAQATEIAATELTRDIVRISDYFAPRYGIPIRESVYASLDTFSQNFYSYLRELSQNGKVSNDSRLTQALFAMPGQMALTLSTVHSDPSRVGGLTQKMLTELVTFLVGQAQAQQQGELARAQQKSNQAIEVSQAFADFLFKAFLA